MYSTHIMNYPLSALEYRAKQSEQASYYEKIIRNINVVLQMDQVYHVCEGLPQVPSPRYVPGNLKMIISELSYIQPREMQT